MSFVRQVHIGTSGWSYDHWTGPFYPEHISRDKHLDYYSGRFHTVEINNSFYNLPQKKTLQRWRDIVGDDFLFSVKASRYITHMKKLKEPEESTDKFFSRIDELKPRLGPILFQLPPRWKINLQRLESFLSVLSEDYRYTFEFRQTSWFDERVYELLSRHNCAFCIYELDRRLSPIKVTADFVYIRLHGPEGAYQGQYSRGVLQNWAKRFDRWQKEGKEIFCYFDNDQSGFAAQDALKLQQMVSGN